MPVRGSLAVRAQFHNVPIELPPPPTGLVHLLEHSYVGVYTHSMSCISFSISIFWEKKLHKTTVKKNLTAKKV